MNAAHLLHVSVDGRQAEARALAERLRREERVEDPLNTSRCVHADARVSDLEHSIGTRRDFPARVGLVEPLAAGPDRQLAALRHRVAGVHGQVQDDLLELAAVAEYRLRRARGVRHNLDVLRDDPSQHRQQVGHEARQADDHRLEHLPSAEREQVDSSRPVGAVGRRLDLADQLEALGASSLCVRRPARSALPRIARSMLLKSCAMPPAR